MFMQDYTSSLSHTSSSPTPSQQWPLQHPSMFLRPAPASRPPISPADEPRMAGPWIFAPEPKNVPTVWPESTSKDQPPAGPMRRRKRWEPESQQRRNIGALECMGRCLRKSGVKSSNLTRVIGEEEHGRQVAFDDHASKRSSDRQRTCRPRRPRMTGIASSITTFYHISKPSAQDEFLKLRKRKDQEPSSVMAIKDDGFEGVEVVGGGAPKRRRRKVRPMLDMGSLPLENLDA